jgi:hypothetical protein
MAKQPVVLLIVRRTMIVKALISQPPPGTKDRHSSLRNIDYWTGPQLVGKRFGTNGLKPGAVRSNRRENRAAWKEG